MEHKKKKVILFIANGLGLSTSRNGNAVLASKHDHLDSLWSLYPHSVLETNEATFGFSEFLFDSYASCGNNFTSMTSQEVIDHEISSGRFLDNKQINETVESAVRHNATIHYVGNISKNNELGSSEHLLELLKIAKKNRAYLTKIHLIIDESYDDMTEVHKSLGSLQDDLATYDEDLLVTVCGSQTVSTQPLRFIKDLAANRGSHMISLTQVCARHKDAQPANLPLCFIGRKSLKRVISNFDSIIFFNHDNRRYQALLRVLSENWAGTALKYVRLLLLSGALDDKIESCFAPIAHNKTLVSMLHENGANVCIAAMTKDMPLLRGAFARNAPYVTYREMPDIAATSITKFRAALEVSLKTLIQNIKSDFIVINFSALFELACRGNFKETVTAVSLFDEALGYFEASAAKHGYTFIISSLFGKAEQLFATNPLLHDHEPGWPSQSHLPLMEISPKKKRSDKSAQFASLQELARPDGGLCLIAQKVYENLQ